MIYKSESPDINIPRDVSIWSFLFDSDSSCLNRYEENEIRGFTNVSDKKHINYRELKDITTHLSTGLSQSHGLRRGDTIVLYAPNSIWFPVVTLSAVRIGAVACGVSPEYNVDELTYSLKTSGAKCIFTTSEKISVVLSATEKCGLSRDNVIFIDERKDLRYTTVAHLIQKGKDQGANGQLPGLQLSPSNSNADVCAFLCFSSGTTGLPKAVMISHGNVIAQCLQIKQATPTDHKKILAALPFYHITGIVHQLHLPILLNANVYVLAPFTLESMLQTVADFKIKELLVVPPIIIRIAREEQIVSKYDLSHVERFSSGAAPLSKEILNLLEQKFPKTGFRQGYGMTESCSCITTHPLSKFEYKYAHKVGTLVASTEARIVDTETGKDCGIGQSGEVWARGPQVTMGYLNNPQATSSTYDKDGYLHTGDIGYFDEEGFLSITDRIKEMIKVKGIAVAPAELENILLGHRLVHDTAVCGIPDERAGERPKAFVVKKAESNALDWESNGRDILQFVNDKVSRPKRIVEIEFVKEIPKSAAGKILRRRLRQVKQEDCERFIVRDEPIKPRI